MTHIETLDLLFHLGFRDIDGDLPIICEDSDPKELDFQEFSS